MNRLREEAEQLRRQGYSYALINAKLGVSKSTMSYWFRDKPFIPNKEVLSRIKNNRSQAGIVLHNKRVEEIEALRKQGVEEIGTISKRDLWMLGLGLYIGEGAKTTETIRISNSDPSVIRLGIEWLKQVFELTDDNFSIRLHLYPDNDLDSCQAFWEKVTGLSERNFRKSSIDRRVKPNGRSGKLKYGTAHLSVISNNDPEKGVRLYRRMNGWIEGAKNQFIQII